MEWNKTGDTLHLCVRIIGMTGLIFEQLSNSISIRFHTSKLSEKNQRASSVHEIKFSMWLEFRNS